MNKNVVIVDFVRSPFHFAKKGKLVHLRPDDMAAQVIRGLIARSNLSGDEVEDLILGCAFPEAEQGMNMAKLVAFLAGLPQSVAGTTVNRFCGSSMQSIHNAAGAIQMGAGQVFICAGIESMTRVPMGGYNPMFNPTLMEDMPAAYMSMGETAENVADRFKIFREAQEVFAFNSQQKAAAAQAAGRFLDEIVPVKINGEIISEDGCIRGDSTLEGLASLKPAFKADGVVTAGTASPLTDGAAACLVCSEDYARTKGWSPLARIRSVAVAGCDPSVMGMGPVAATRKALERADLTMADIDVVEINEAFASQSLACMDELGMDADRVNIDGGAIALGHPLGATGARITGKVAALIKRDGKKYGLSTQCIGGGQGIATVLEAV